jgi:uncharacterized protein
MHLNKLQKSAYLFGKILTYLILWVIFLVIFIGLYEVIIRPSLGGNKAYEAFFAELMPVLGMLVTNWTMYKRTVNGKLDIYQFNLSNFLLATGVGAIWLGTSLIGQISTTTLYFKFGPNEIQSNTILIYALALLLNTVFQELLFRGYLFKILEDNLNPNLAIIISSIMFMGLHFGAIQAGFVPAFNVFGAGVIFAILFYKTRSIWVPIITHFIWNFTVVYLGVSKIPGYPSSNQLTLYGNTYLAGGENGIEATVTTTAIIIIMIVILWKYQKST